VLSSSARERNSESISSTNKTHGANLLATENTARINCDVSPTYFLSRDDGVRDIIGMSKCLQNDFASAVFPHPI
jgi:hypothetical protein